MTLVIARITDKGIRIDSDSKLTDPAVIRPNPLSGVLKTIVLDRTICVSYAGAVIYAQEAIEHLYSLNRRMSANEVVVELVKINLKSNAETDFLVVSLQGTPTIYKISNRKVETSKTSSWIGEYSAFNLFQQEFIKGAENKDQLKLQGDIFENILTSRKVESVGGFLITVHSTLYGLQYMIKVDIRMGTQQIKLNGPGEFKIPLGTAENGSYGTNYLASKNIDKPAVAIHFPHGNFGGLIYPKHSRSIQVIKDVDGHAFIEKVKELYGIDLGGLIVENDGFRMM